MSDVQYTYTIDKYVGLTVAESEEERELNEQATQQAQVAKDYQVLKVAAVALTSTFQHIQHAFMCNIRELIPLALAVISRSGQANGTGWS